jgi:DNA-binding PadR family transcriptional regulator
MFGGRGHYDCHRGRWGGGGGNWGGWGGWAGWGERHRAGRGPFRGGRMFAQGDLKYVILQLLTDKPRHGYEIIRTLEERMGGTYAPSPGAVYPTLTMLEEMGYASATTDAAGRKIYDITPEGRAYLEQNRSQVDEIFARISDFATTFFGGPMVDVHRAFKDLARATYSTAMQVKDQASVRKIHDILEQAASEIEAIGKQTPS